MDSQNLAALLANASGRDSTDDVLPWCGTDYKVSDIVIGEGATRHGAASAILFACGRGVSACSAVFARVTVDAETIT